ncbi:MAG TPA: hypothetical protein VI032_03825 [Burkholderiaceae bacterium]
MNLFARRSVLVQELGQTYLSEPDADWEEARTLRPLQATAITYRIAFGWRFRQRVMHAHPWNAGVGDRFAAANSGVWTSLAGRLPAYAING